MALSVQQLREQDLADPHIKSISMMQLLPGDVIYVAINKDENSSIRLALVVEQEKQIVEIVVDGIPAVQLKRPVSILTHSNRVLDQLDMSAR